MQVLQPNTLLQGGKYRIERVLGQGGFGITYLAIQDILDRKVAIKEFFFRDYCERDSDTSHVKLGTQSNKETVERFLNKFIKEARTISALHHPAIIPIYDIFRENGTAYYVMEYIEGESLGDMVKRRGSLPEAEALSYIRSVGDALTYIHQRNINHLDIKPSNIMLRRYDNQVVLIDFGVAKQYDEQTMEGTTTTPVGISHGYSPAEQYRRNGVQTFSPQSDVYALGATLYKLLSGKTPPEATEIPDIGLPVEILRQKGVSETVINAIVKAMLPRSSRTQSVSEFLSNISEQESNQEAKIEEATVIFVEPESEKVNQPPLPPSSSIWTSPKTWIRFVIGACVCALILIPLIVLRKALQPKIEQNATTIIKLPEEEVNSVTNKRLTIPLGECNYTGPVDAQGRPNGDGEAKFTDGRLYRGLFINGVAQGPIAYFEYENGDVYEGSFKKNSFEQGRYTLKEDGSYFVGTFKGGNPDQGNWYDKSGNKIE